MYSRIKNIFLLAAFALVGYSCAEQVEINTNELQLESFRSWMAKYYPDYPEVEDGLYYKIIKGENASGYKPDSITDWVYVNYMGTDLLGNYFANCYEPLAVHLGTYARTTHFVPLISNLNSNNKVLSYGAKRALTDMQVGDSVDIFMASEWAGSAISAPYNGFEGNLPSVSGAPARVSLKFEAMTDDPLEDEVKAVEEYAVKKLGLTVADSISEGLYYKLITKSESSDTVPADSTINLWYTGRFLDGFVFDTNVQKVGEENGIVKESTDDFTSAWMSVQFCTEGNTSDIDQTYIDGFTEVARRLKVGEKAVAVFTSAYGYGVAGSTSGATIIQPYDPLVFEIQVLTPEESEEELETGFDSSTLY